MIFAQKHRPQSVNDLVFAETHVRDLVIRYATKRPSKSLLLYGAPGTGKSEAIRLIAETIFKQANVEGALFAHNGADATPDVFNRILNEANMQMLQGMERALIIVDEVDEYEGKLPSKMRTFIEQHPSVQFLCTTNHLNKIKPALKSRFKVVEVKQPLNTDWTARAQAIFTAEGFSINRADIQQILQSFDGDARDLIDLIEEYIQSAEPVAPATAPSAQTVAQLLSGAPSQIGGSQ
jgi:replication-associated recombination protein RarA